MKHEISIEFFPPQTPEGMEKLRATWVSLAELKPAFFSVTYRAGGSTRERTFSVVKEIVAGGFAAAPHLSCIGSTRDSIREILNEYKAAGIRRTVALRGDLPSGMAEAGEFRYANELVEFIRSETGDWFSIEVAAYPEWHPQARHRRQSSRRLHTLSLACAGPGYRRKSTSKGHAFHRLTLGQFSSTVAALAEITAYGNPRKVIWRCNSPPRPTPRSATSVVATPIPRPLVCPCCTWRRTSSGICPKKF